MGLHKSFSQEVRVLGQRKTFHGKSGLFHHVKAFHGSQGIDIMQKRLLIDVYTRFMFFNNQSIQICICCQQP